MNDLILKGLHALLHNCQQAIRIAAAEYDSQELTKLEVERNKILTLIEALQKGTE
jgi:hypothetical protein